MPTNAIQPGRRPLKRGGARNRAERQSWHLDRQYSSKIIRAAQEAWAAGMPLNRFVTISWEPCGIDPRQSVKATGEWIKLAREWMAAQGFKMPWAWVQERGPRLGAHCHILLHVPPQLAPLFRGRPERWARKIVRGRAGRYVRGTVWTRQVTMGNAPESAPEAYGAALMGRVHYMLKCAPAELEASLGMTSWGSVPWGQSCLVYGKRAGVWQRKAGSPKIE